MKQFFVASLLLATLSGCNFNMDWNGGSDELKDGTPITTSAKAVGAFDEVSLLGSDDLEIVEGDRTSIMAKGDADAVKLLRYTIKDGNLIVGRKPFEGSVDGEATIVLTAPSVSHVSGAGAGDIRIARLSGNKVEWGLAGSGDIEVVRVDAKTLEGNLAGSGKAKMAGKAEEANFSIAGSGDIDAPSLSLKRAEISVAGSGNAKLNASEKVTANIAGSGDIDVTGGAKCSLSSVGSGELNCGK